MGYMLSAENGILILLVYKLSANTVSIITCFVGGNMRRLFLALPVETCFSQAESLAVRLTGFDVTLLHLQTMFGKYLSNQIWRDGAVGGHTKDGFLEIRFIF